MFCWWFLLMLGGKIGSPVIYLLYFVWFAFSFATIVFLSRTRMFAVLRIADESVRYLVVFSSIFLPIFINFVVSVLIFIWFMPFG